MSFLYVVEKFATIRLDQNQIIAEKNGVKTYIPIETLEGIVLIGNSNISSGCLAELLRRNLPVTFLSTSGIYYGRLDSTKNTNIVRQRLQFKLGDDYKFCLDFSKKTIEAKINNQIIILKRYNRTSNIEQVEKDITTIKIYRDKVEESSTIEQLMGYEGIASRTYFNSLSLIINPLFKFKGRNRMPPTDPFNSVLSLAYTLLFYEIYTAVSNRGLNVYAGFMHKDKHNHPALISDLIEEWRAVIVDSLVINLFNSNAFIPEHFETNTENAGIHLTHEGVKVLMAGFEKKLKTTHGYFENLSYKVSFRKSFDIQTNSLAKAIESGNGYEYSPIIIR